MANNLHFEYSLSVNEKQTQQNLATFMKKTFGTDKNAKLSVPIKLDITTNLTNVDLKTIQDQIDKQFKGKLTLNATVKVDASNVARQAQAELDRISKGLSLKVGLEIDPSAMKLMLGTVDVIKTLNKEITKVKDNLKDLGKKIEININGAQINNMYEGALKTAEKIQKVNAQTTEEINDQLKATKEQLAHQKKLSEEKKKELDIEKEKQANNKKIEQSNRKIREQQLQNEKELKNIEKQITAEKKKAELLEKQAQSSKTNAKAQADATEKIEKSTKKIADLEKERANNQAFLASKREEQKQLMVNIELNNQEISQLRTKIKEMERLGKTAVTTTRKITGGTTAPKSTTTRKPRKPKNSNVVQVDTSTASAPVQATVQATNAVNDLAQAEKNVTDTINQQTETKVKSVNDQIKAQNKLVQNTVDTAKKVEEASNRTYRAQDSKRTLRMPNGRDKIYNRIAGSEFASSLAGYRIHDITSAEEQTEYELVLLNTLVKSRNVLTDFNIELKEGVALTEEQVKLIEERIRLIQKEMVDTKELAGSKDKADRDPFSKALKAYLADPTNEELGSKLDFQAEKVSKIGAMYKYHSALLKEKNRLEGMLGVKVKENAEVEAKRLEMEAKRDERATGIRAKTMENQSNRALNKNIYKDAGDFLKEEVFGFEPEQLDDMYEEYYEELAEQADMLSEAIGEKFNFAKQGQVNYEEIDRYFKTIAKKTEEWKEQMASASDADKKKLQDNIEYAEEDVKYLKMLANSITTVNYLANIKSDASGEYFDVDNIEEATEAIESFADPKLVSKVRTQAENFDLFINKTHALNEQTHQVKGEVLAVLACFDRLNKSTSATSEDWEELANKLTKYSEVLGKTTEEIDEFAIAEINRDKKAEEARSLMKATIKQGKEYVKQLQQQMSTMDRETEAWEKRNKAINVFKQLAKDESISKEKMDEQVLGLYNLLTTKEKDSGDFKESNSSIKIIRKKADAEQDVAVKYEKQANALYEILKLKKEGKKVSFDINKLIDSEGNGWEKIAEQQEKFYRRMNDHQLWFTASHMNMNETYADKDNIFDPANFIDFTQDLEGRENIIKFLSEATAKMHILEELQEKMKTHKPMQNGKSNLDIANKTTQAKIEEARAMDAITAKQKEQQENEKIHQKWLEKQELAKDKEPYLKASKEIIKRIKGSTKYKNNKDDEKFMNSVKQTFMYIDNLKHSEATLQQTVDAFEQLKTYAHETFNMKNETIQKLVEPFVGIKEETKEIKQELDKTDKNMDDVAKKADQVNQATQEQAQAESKIAQQVEAQAQAQSKAKDDAKATAEAMESQAKSQKTITDELRKRLVEATSEDFVSKIPSEMLEKMYQGVDIAVAKGIKLTKTKIKDIVAVADGLNQLDYSKILGERGALVASGRRKKDGVFINRTDAYKAQKEAMDKQVDELEKPLLEIFKIMEKDLKGTVDKVKKEVKKAEPKKDKVEQQVNKTKQEQNKLSQQQVQAENKVSDAKLKQLNIAKQILEADKKHKDYILDIDTLTDAQGRTWKDIYKNSEKVYKGLSDEVLFGQFANATAMHVAYQKTSNSVFDAGRYVDNSKYEGTPQDRKLVMSLMNEFDAKTAVLESLKQVYMGLEYKEANVTQEVKEQVVQQEKVETSLYDQIQAIEKMTNAQKRFNAILGLTGLNYDKVLKEQSDYFKNATDWQKDKALQNMQMNKIYGEGVDGRTDPYSFLSYDFLPPMPEQSRSVQDINALSSIYAVNHVLSAFKEMKNKETRAINNAIEAKEEERQKIGQATNNVDNLKNEIASLEDELKSLNIKPLDDINKRINEIEKNPIYSENMKNLEEEAKKNLKAGGLKIDDKSIMQNISKMLQHLKMNHIYEGALGDTSGAEAMGENYGLKNVGAFLKLDAELSKLIMDKSSTESAIEDKRDIEEKLKLKREELDLATKEVETKEKQAVTENKVADNKQKQVTVQKQIIQAKQDGVKVSESEAKAESEIVDNAQKLVNLETQRKRILSSIKYTKEDMLSYDELDKLKEDLKLNKEKTRELRKQGETAKFLEKVKEDAEEGQSAKLANKRLQEIFKNQNRDYSKYGITDVDKFIKEQKAIGVLSNEQVGMKQEIEAQRSLQDELYEYEKQLKNVDKQIEEINSKKQEELKITQDVAKVTEQMSNTLEEPLKDLKTLEEYQREYTKKSGFTHTEETFEGLDESMHEKHKFSDNAIGYLDVLLGKFRKTGGGVDASYAGLGLPRELIDSLGSENLNKIIAEHMEKYHKEYGKVARMYKDLAYLAETLGGNVEGNKEFEELNLKVTQLEEKIRKEAIALINDALLSTDNIWYQDEKYDDANDIRIMGESNVYRTAMSDTDYYVDHQDYDELVKTSKEKLANLLKNKKVTQEVVQEVKNENKETQNLAQSVNKIVEDKKDEVEIQAKIVEDKKDEVDTSKQLVDVKQQDLNVTNKIAEAVQEVKEEEEVLNKFVEKGNEDWYKTYQYLSRVVESSSEFARAGRFAKEEWEELKEEADMSETDDQWKEMVKRVYEFANGIELAFKTEKGLYDARKQALKDINILSKSPEEVVKENVERMKAEAQERLNKANKESLDIVEKKNELGEQEANTENKVADAKTKNNKVTQSKNKTNKQAVQEMISIPKSTNTGDYMRATIDAIKKVSKNSTFKKNADANLVKELADLSTEANINKSSSKANIEYWESIIKRLKDIGSRGHVQETTIDNMLLPKIGGTMPLAKANNAVKEKAQASATPTVTKEEVDNAKKVETSVQNTAKAKKDVANTTSTVKVETNDVAKATKDVKQNIEETTESLEDLKDITVSNAEANKEHAKQIEEQEKAENKKAESSKKAVDAKKEEAEVTQEVKSELQDIIGAKVQESKLENQIVDKKEEEQDIVDDIADTQKEVIVISQQVQEIDEEKLNAMKEELANREKMKAEQQAGLSIVKDEIKLAEKKDKELSKSIKQQETLINKEQEKIAKMQDSEESARIANEERMKERAELEAHIKLLQQQAEEKRNNIALLESEFEETEDNTIKVKLLTEEYDKLQTEIRKTEELVDDLSDAYYRQQEEVRKANNEASQNMIDNYMAQFEKQEEARRKERAKYPPAISGEVGEYKGGDRGNVPPSGGGNPPDGNDPDLDERIKLRQRELMLSLQQAVYNKELNDEQKMGVQILAEQILEIGQLASSMKDLTWLSQNFRENLKEFKFSIKVDEDNKKELARIAEEERKELTNMYAGLFDEIDANEKLKAEKQSLEELIALYKEKTLAQVDEYSAKNSNYVDSNRVSELRDMIQYMEQNISSAGEYEQVVRNIGNVFRELKFDTNQTKQWYKMEQDAEKSRVAKEKEAEAQDKLNKELEEHIRIKKEQAQLYAKEILSSSAMRKATEEERQEMERLITQYNITGSSVKEVNQCYAEMQRSVKNMRLNIMSKQLMEQDTWLDKVKNGIKDYVRFTLDLDDIQGVMQNVTRLFQSSFEHVKVLDEAYTNVNQTMKVSQEEFNGMRDVAYEVADANGALGTEMLEMVKIYAGANVEIEEVNNKLAGTVAFQNISGLTGTDATNALQTIINQFKLTTDAGYESGEAIQYVGDTISGVAYNLSKDEGDAMREIISAVEDAGAVIESSGGSLEWYSALTGTLAETMNATGSEVGGAMRMITARTLQQKEAFDELNDSGEETEVAMANAEKALANLGISIRGSDGDLRSIEEVLGDVAEKWDTLSDSDQQFVAEKLAGTNRRTYFMSLMENYERVIELQGIAQESEGNMMEASEKYAQSLTGKLNQLTNAQEQFYQTLMSSDAMKSWVEKGTDAIKMITDIVQAMDGKWIPAIVAVVTAHTVLRTTVNEMSFSDFIGSIGTCVKKLFGLQVEANATTIAMGALKGVLVGFGVGVVVTAISSFIGHLSEANQKAEMLSSTVSTLKENLNTVGDTGALILEYQKAVENLDLITEGTDQYIQQQERINELRNQLINAQPGFKYVLENETMELDEQIERLKTINSYREKQMVQEAVDEAMPYYSTLFGDNVEESILEPYETSMYETQRLLDSMAKYESELQDFEAKRAEALIEGNDAVVEEMDANIANHEEYLRQGAESLAGFYEWALQMHEDASTWNELFDLADLYNIDMEGEKINLDGLVEGGEEALELAYQIAKEYGIIGEEATEASGNVDELTNSTDEATNSANELADAMGDVADEASKSPQFKANEQYIEQLNNLEEIQTILDQIDEEGYTLDIATDALESGWLDDYTGSIEDMEGVQEHLNKMIAETEKLANSAYYNMMKDDEEYWANKMSNSQAWRDHEQIMQDEVVKLAADALGIQETDFANFIDSKGGFREVDYSNAYTMAEAEDLLQSSLLTQVSGYSAQLVDSKAGNRQTDMGNIVQFLNTQGAKEAQTVQELAQLWAQFYDAKAKAIQAEINDYNSRTAQIQEAYNLALGEEAWLEDNSLKHGMLNNIKKLSQLNIDNANMTNYFAGLLGAGFGGVGGGVPQDFTGGKGTGGGGGLSNKKPSSKGTGGGSGSSPSRGSGSGGKGGSGGSGSSEKDVEDLELETDRYYELNDAINDLNNQMDMLRAKRESITTKKDYKKSIQDEVALINKQIQAYKNLQKEQQKERNEIKKTLSKNGFKFNKNGDISNYEEQLKKLQNKANKKTGQAKEDAIEQVQTLVDLIDRYNELHNEAIPETSLEVQNLQQEIANLNTDLAENLKDIEDLADMYFTLNRRIEKVNDALDMNRALQEYATDEEKISLMEDEIDLLEQQQKLLKENKVKAEEEAKSIREQLKELGVAFDKEGNITNYDTLLESLQKYANSLVGEAQQDAIDEIEELKDLIDQYVVLTEDTLPDLDLEWQNIANTIEGIEKDMQDMYREQQEEAVQTQKDIADAYSYYLKKRYDELKESLKKEQEIYNKTYEEENFQRDLSDQQQVLDELAQQIAIYERDTSEAGKAKLAQLKKEYEEQQKAINDMIRDNEHEKANENFDKETESLDKELEDLLSPEKLIKTVNDAIASGFITVGDEVMSLGGLMNNWLDETGDGLYALGDILKTELVDQLANAQQILKDMGLTGAGRSIGLSSTSLIEKALSTGTSDSKSANVEFTAPLLYVEGNVDDGNIDDLLEKLDDVKEEIYATIAKNLQLK